MDKNFEAKSWYSIAYPVKMDGGEVTEYKIDGKIWVAKSGPVKNYYDPVLAAKKTEKTALVTKSKAILTPDKAVITHSTPKQRRKGKITYFKKYIKKLAIGTIVDLNNFYHEYPKHEKDIECKRRVQRDISELISDGTFEQLSNTQFKKKK